MENTELINFYYKNLEKLDTQWKNSCFNGTRSIKESGDLYFNTKAFWKFVSDKFRERK